MHANKKKMLPLFHFLDELIKVTSKQTNQCQCGKSVDSGQEKN